MTIEVRCDCGKVFKVADEHAGKRGRCPACKRVLEIPEAPPAPGAPEPTRPPEEPGPAPQPRQRVERGGPSRSSLPWQERERHGFVAALFKTLGEVLLRPSDAFSSIQVRNSLGSSLIYVLILGTAGAWISYAIQFGMQAGLAGAAQQGGAGRMGAGAGPWFFMGGMMMGLALLAPVFVILGSFIGAGVLHLCLMLVGGANETFEATYAVAAYAQGSTAPLTVVPFCGGLVAAVWGIVIQIIGLAKAHRTTTGKAALAVLLPAILLCGIGVLVFLVMAGTIAARAGQGA